MTKRNLADLHRDIAQPLGRVIQEAFEDGMIITSKTFLDFAPVFVPDSARSNFAFAIGKRGDAGELDVTMLVATTQHLDPIQMNLNIIGANPTGVSTINLIYTNITHDTVDMSNLRLKCADWNVVVGKDVLDAYVYQGEIDFIASGVAVGGEATVLGLVMNAGDEDVAGNLRGLIISMQGAGTHNTAIGLEIRTTCGHSLGTGLAEGIRIAGTPLPVVAIAMGNQDNDNEGPQNAFFFPSAGGADEGPCVGTVKSGDGEGSIKILVGATTKYLKYWSDPS